MGSGTIVVWLLGSGKGGDQQLDIVQCSIWSDVRPSRRRVLWNDRLSAIMFSRRMRDTLADIALISVSSKKLRRSLLLSCRPSIPDFLEDARLVATVRANPGAPTNLAGNEH
jgi:hypothetical protein